MNMSETNILRDLSQISKKDNDIEAEYHKWPWAYSGASNKGSCKSLRTKRLVGIKLPDVTGMKADKGAMEIGKMGHADTQKKLKDKYKNHKKIKCGVEVYTIQTITPPSDHKITVNIDNSMYYPKGTVLKDLGMTSISPWDVIFYSLKKDVKSAIVKRIVKFRNLEAEVPFLDIDKIDDFQIIDIKTAGDFGFYKMLKEGLPWRYQAQGHIYIRDNNLPYIDFLVIHKEKNLKYIIRLFWSDTSWRKLVEDQERVLQMAYETLEHGDCEEFWDDFECLEKTIGWYSCPLSTVKETVDKKTKKKRMEIVSFCPRAQELLISMKKKLFPVESSWKYGRAMPHIINHSFDENKVATVVYCNKGEYKKRLDGKDHKTIEIPLALAFQKFKPDDYVEPRFPTDQTLIEYKNGPEIDMCTKCGAFVGGICENYGVVPASYPERPEWCFFPIPKEVK